MHRIHNAGPLWSNHRITDDLPDDVAQTILQHPSYSEAPEGLLPYDPNRIELTSGGIVHATPALISEPASKPTAADNRRAALAKANATRAAKKAAKV